MLGWLSAIESKNPISNAEGMAAPASGRQAQHPNGVSGVRLAAFNFFVKKEKISKVVDENGEPLVVYHGVIQGGFTIKAKSRESYT